MTKFDQLISELTTPVTNTSTPNAQPTTPVNNNQVKPGQPNQQTTPQNQTVKPPVTSPSNNKPIDGNAIINALANNKDPKTFEALRNASKPEEVTKIINSLQPK